MKGRISYVSQDFANISGFSEEEMLGEPHNLIRHPDVPSEIFREMWETIQDGNPWSGIIKNRAKSGDYYWVDATVTPVMNEGVISGYMSVRKKATEDQIRRAEILFSQLKNTKFISLEIKRRYSDIIQKTGAFRKDHSICLTCFRSLIIRKFRMDSKWYDRITYVRSFLRKYRNSFFDQYNSKLSKRDSRNYFNSKRNCIW
ncbi:PAS domain S-box protein [Leptospira interrogans str. 2002000626]|uniref:PAS domain S-box protein n=1 Tax=Leptospira interrogans str. 2002000626 TaxID=996803 RepID=A0A829D4L2_LEPIR|nr:PAS domain S-box protein [Leptospira interrogans str. 2002000626]